MAFDGSPDYPSEVSHTEEVTGRLYWGQVSGDVWWGRPRRATWQGGGNIHPQQPNGHHCPLKREPWPLMVHELHVLTAGGCEFAFLHPSSPLASPVPTRPPCLYPQSPNLPKDQSCEGSGTACGEPARIWVFQADNRGIISLWRAGAGSF